jgi:hypothetical protein
MTQPWHIGQRCVINRDRIVTVERITPSGRVVADGYLFNADGVERRPTGRSRRDRLEPLTPEIEAEMALRKRAQDAYTESDRGVERAVKWVNNLFGWGRYKDRSADEVAKAEALAAAIRSVLGDGADV